MGDTSSKVGTYNIGKGKRFYADEDTPLFGKYTGTRTDPQNTFFIRITRGKIPTNNCTNQTIL